MDLRARRRLAGSHRPILGRCLLPILVAQLLAACSTPADATAESGVDGTVETLDWARFAPIEFGGEGRITGNANRARLGAGSPLTGLRWAGPPLPTVDYRLAFTATRQQGSDFFCGLTFPVRDSHCTLILGGWGGALVGLSCIDGADASENDTTTHASFVNGQEYRVQLEVSAARITVAIDGRRVIDAAIAGRSVSLRADVDATRPLAVCSYATVAEIGVLQLTRLPGRL
jgi:hypothetical protein